MPAKSHTYVLSFERKWPLSVVRQMIGRSCRSFGVSVGTFLTHTMSAHTDITDYLSRLEPDFKDGAMFLHSLYAHYNKHDKKNKALLRKFFE